MPKYQRAVSDFRHRKYLSFRKGRSSPVYSVTAIDPNHFWLTKSGGEPIGIPCVVVVGVAVRVHIAEVVAVVVIRGTLPPISSGTPGVRRTTPRQGLQRYT